MSQARLRRRFPVPGFGRRRFRRSPAGYGLGLALCKWIAEVHHASLTVKSAPGKGSVFTVIFPALPLQAGGVQSTHGG